MTAPSSVAAAFARTLHTHENLNGVVTLSLNTPRNLNALSLEMIEALDRRVRGDRERR